VISLFVAVTVFGAEPKTEEQKTLYALGVAVSKSLALFNLSKADLEMVQAGVADGVFNKPLKVNLQEYGPKIASLQQSRQGAAAEKSKQAGKAFAAKAAAEKGSTKTDSGLIYIPTKEGSGAVPAATDSVKVHYQGTLIDGNVFDSSVQRGEPATFALNQVIPCWTEGLQRMKVGGKARLVCPSDIAYGDSGRPPVIPAGATLVFEVELLEIVKP
jgi:FKBP-type peptidyl-prolyl cis-trans isomerase FkpA/FKBP-type peptidyl-prolyl cis-trans isomerase FklB